MQPLQKRDYQKFFIEKGDADFSPEHNKAVIENSIKKYDAKRAALLNEFKDNVAERADAVVTYLKSIDRGGANRNLDGFFSRGQIARLQGRDVQEKIMEGLTILRNKKQLQHAKTKFQSRG